MSDANPVELCSARVSNGWNYSQCPHKSKGTLKDGRPGCGVHLAAERRVKENDERRNAEYEARNARRKPLIELCDELGITRLVDWEGRYINLGLADAKALLARLKANG